MKYHWSNTSWSNSEYCKNFAKVRECTYTHTKTHARKHANTHIHFSVKHTVLYYVRDVYICTYLFTCKMCTNGIPVILFITYSAKMLKSNDCFKDYHSICTSVTLCHVISLCMSLSHAVILLVSLSRCHRLYVSLSSCHSLFASLSRCFLFYLTLCHAVALSFFICQALTLCLSLCHVVTHVPLYKTPECTYVCTYV